VVAPHPVRRRHVERAHVKPKKKKVVPAAKPRRTPPSKPNSEPAAQQHSAAALAATPTAGSGGAISPTLLLTLVGFLLALVAIGVSLVPVWSVPLGVGVRIERNRQTIALAGLAIGVACAFVALLDVLSGG
jgi:hypothetical protein